MQKTQEKILEKNAKKCRNNQEKIVIKKQEKKQRKILGKF